MAVASHFDCRVGYNAEMRWSLASMFIATAFVAVAAWAARYGATMPDALRLLAVPPLLGVAVGTLAGRVGLGIRYGVAADIVLVAAWAARYGVTMPDAPALLAVFPLLGAAVGTLAGRVGLWVSVGVAIDISIGLALMAIGWLV